MSGLSDNELIDELRKRFERNQQALHDLKVLTETLGDLNRKLTESEELKSNFLANIRNEINNPLTAILGLSRVLVDQHDAERSGKLAQLIYAEAFDFHFQLRNILTAASLEAGEMSPFYARVDIGQLLRMTSDSFGHRYSQKGLQVRIHCDVAEERFISSDAEKIQLILSNLIANAIEFSSPGGKVAVEVNASAAELSLAVRDEGRGIPPEQCPVIFDRFRQLDMGSSKQHRGHGIGLSITKEMVELLGGAISVAGNGAGGTTVQVVLPLADASGPERFFADSGNAFIFEAEGEGEGPEPVTI